MAVFPLLPEELAELIQAVEAERVSVASGRLVLREAVATGKKTAELLAARGEQISDEAALESWLDQVLADHPDAVKKIQEGDEKPFAFLMGQVMRLSRGKANPRKVSDMLRARAKGG